MEIYESEIENYIFNDLTQNHGCELFDRGLRLYSTEIFKDFSHDVRCTWVRQLNLGKYGKCDIVGYFREGQKIHIQLLELKAVSIESGDFDQILRYKSAIRDYLRDRFELQFHLFLIGEGLRSGHYIHDNIGLNVIEYQYSLNGVRFLKHQPKWYLPFSETEDFDLLKSIRNAKKVHG